MAGKKARKISLILYTLHAYGTHAKDAARALKRVKKIGYETVQVSGSFRHLDPAEMRVLADDAGLQIIGAHIGIDDFRNDLSAVIETLHTYGAEYVAIPMYRPPEGIKPQAGWKRFAKECNRIGRALKKEGIQLQYHNHAFEFEKFGIRGGRGGRTAHEILFKESDPDLLQTELDLGWVARGGMDPAAYIKQFKGRVDQVHIKDWGIQGDDPVWRAVGEGNLNWKNIIRSCKQAGVQTYIVEQDSCPITNDPFRSITLSFENMMQMAL